MRQMTAIARSTNSGDQMGPAFRALAELYIGSIVFPSASLPNPKNVGKHPMRGPRLLVQPNHAG